MLISVYVPFAVTAVLTLLAPRLARRLSPRPAAWALACAALVTAGGWAGSLALLAFTGIAQIPQVAAEGHWSVAALRAEDPVYVVVAAVSALVLVACAASLCAAAFRQARQVIRARRECAGLRGDTELAVLDDDVPLAFALPGAPGRIVVSRGMLTCLGSGERAALLAHERAHLRGRHHLFLGLWQLTAAVNPLLRPLADTGAFVLERWADEEAAAHVGDRAIVARAVARAALASAGASRPALLAATGGEVPQRVRALLAPPPARRSLPFLAGALLLTVCCASLANAASDSDDLVDSAKRAQCAVRVGSPSAPPTGEHRHGLDFCCGPHHRGERGESRPSG
ncbi:M56 family metallopeptidase [Streptomyces spiralis]|uniref:M56 family metallopeptidase n=1 Tax=Streptomyces spiralis TaxID=66376 RepID=UPI0033D5B834